MNPSHLATPARSLTKPLATTVAALLTSTGILMATPGEAQAYDWKRTLKEGSTGADVKELQIRVAGWAADSASKTHVGVDGDFGAGTKAAVTRFQKAYGLSANGTVDASTQKALNALEDSDGTKNFNFSEFHSKDGSKFSGGKVSEATVKENVRRMMYKLEAMRKKSGNKAISINSGFRSIKHNTSVGGASNSQHMYGIAADIVISGKSVSNTISYAKTSGYSGIIRYATFTHVDNRAEHSYGSSAYYWKD
ncbi:D-Ala-D-Ala carboxypeptidase family metallohydrolase [Demetria terragena]|uniref:D-Ala-D-Ala carboxypeptidase family metallohydrolase n=1 Tax=Demetria terragena TaxID=63959 RepID=UPI000367B7E8|nr:D-Ala-D-Ala carboxypeptidase family metallohydrolase [Demetria terragena]